MKINYTGKLVLITGGSSGIGLALAKQLAAEGANVHILSRDKDRLANALAELQALSTIGQEVGTIQADVVDQKALDSTLTKWVTTHGTPDLLINSAGVAHPGYFQDLSIEIFQWMMDVNYFGMVNITKTLIPYMIVRGSGQVVNISSEAGFIGVFGYTAYGASKYAVRGFSDALRAEMKPLGIDMSLVFPPDTQTPQLDYENQFKPSETKAIAGSTSIMTAEKVANIIIRNIKRKRYFIIPGFEGKIFYRLTSILKHSTYPIMDMMVRSAQKKKLRKIKKLLD
ncbi:MAG: SDR family oxidoreductase [Anaerolineaceae bacterium]|nr:SDR family oxidoreductase [Anaerolineaceae bacterium]